MYVLWKLVLLAVISAGQSSKSDLENIDDLNKEKSNQRTLLSKYDIISQSKFQCQNKPSGYYADPQYDCKVFHYCQQDGTKITIPCILNIEEHKICVFRDVVSTACESSEIYLALPEDLQVKTSKETTASTINNATDFKLSSVLPIPSSSENNHSTTPLSLDFNKRNNPSSLLSTKETDSIFEVINSVLREIQADDDEKLSIDPKVSKLSPSSFRRGTRFQSSSIRRDDSSSSLQTKDNAKNEDTFLVEVYQKRNEKLTDKTNHYHKKSKKILFLPKLENPAAQPRRKKRTVAEPLNVSRPYAVIYAKVPEDTRSSNSRSEERASNQRLDILEVPFAPARVPANVPTIPITIETRRKKKSKSKKKPKNISHAIFFQENVPQEIGNEQTSEQQNVLFFAPEETADINLQSTGNRIQSNNRQSSRQNSEQFNSNPESPLNNAQSNYQTSLSNQAAIPLEITNFPFQSTTFLTDSAIPQYYFATGDIGNSDNFPSFNLQDQFAHQQQQPRIPQQNSFILTNDGMTQSVRPNKPESQTRQRDNDALQKIRQTQNTQHQTNPQQENHSHQGSRNPNNRPQSTRQQEVIPQTIQSDNRLQNIRTPETIAPQYFSQPEFNSQNFRQPENILQSHRQPGNFRPQSVSEPQNIQVHSVREPGNVQTQILTQPEIIHTQTLRQPENIPQSRPSQNTPTQIFNNPQNTQPEAFRYTLGIQPQTIGEPEFIQPQSLGQFQNIYLQNLNTFPFGHDVHQQTIRQPRPQEQSTNLQNSANDSEDKKKNEREKKPQQNLQAFSGFDSPFFQPFSNYRSPNFNDGFRQHAPQSFDILSPNTVRYQEHINPSQFINTGEKLQVHIDQQAEKPQDQNIPHLIIERPQNYIPQQHGNQIRQQLHNNRDPTLNHQTSSVQQQPYLNPNVINSDRVIQERPTQVHDINSQNFVSVPEVSRPLRNRVRTTVLTAPTTRTPNRQRSRAQPTPSSDIYNTRRPQENTRIPQRHQDSLRNSNSHTRPTQSPRLTSAVVYNPQYESEISGGLVPNDVHNRHSTTISAPDLRVRQHQKPHNTRNTQRDRDLNQKPRNTQYYYDSNSRQTQPQYSSYHHSPTTPLPSYTPHERTRQTESYQNHGTYRQNPRQVNKESARTTESDKSYYRLRTTSVPYGRSRSRTSTTREQSTEKLPVTNMYFVTSTPRFRHTEEPSYSRRPQQLSDKQHEKKLNRPQAQIEGPPQDYVKAEPVREEIRSRDRYYSNPQPHSNYENDVNIISTAEDPEERQRTTSVGSARRPGYRGSSVNERPRYNPDIEHGFLPVTEKPPRERIYTTRISGNEYHQTPKTYEREYSYATSAPAREYVTRVPEREYGYTSRNSEREFVTRVPEKEYAYTSRTSEREYPYFPRNTERELSYSTTAPTREHSRYYPEPEEHSSIQRAPNRHREQIHGNSHENRYQNHYEEIPTTRSTTTTTTTRPTKKPRPPPPKPTFPPFPTFPPPPRRIPTPPRPQTESPKYENRRPDTTEHVTEDSLTTSKAISNPNQKVDFKSEISEPRYVTENYISTSTLEDTTRRKSRKRRPRPRRPKTTTPYMDDEDPIQVESITQATTHKEVSTRLTPSNYNRWRQQTPAIKKTTTTTPPTSKPSTETSDKSEEFGSRLNLFGRPRTRKPTFNARPQTTTPTSSNSNERKSVTKSPTALRTRKPFVKKIKKKLTTTTEEPDATESIARSDENTDILHFDSDINFQALESATQFLVENMDAYQSTDAYKDDIDTTTETLTLDFQDDVDSEVKSESFESTRSLSQKFQNRPRILKFGKPRLKTTDSPI